MNRSAEMTRIRVVPLSDWTQPRRFNTSRPMIR
jgi:hypothetical protein